MIGSRSPIIKIVIHNIFIRRDKLFWFLLNYTVHLTLKLYDGFSEVFFFNRTFGKKTVLMSVNYLQMIIIIIIVDKPYSYIPICIYMYEFSIRYRCLCAIFIRRWRTGLSDCLSRTVSREIIVIVLEFAGFLSACDRRRIVRCIRTGCVSEKKLTIALI